MRFIDLTGKRFGKMVVISETSMRKNKKVVWQCICDCGNTTFVTGSDLVTGNTVSCGCMSSRVSAGERTKTHGMSKTSIYSIWSGMKKRCYNEACKSYKDYGASGISVCDRWQKFENFYEDMSATYVDGLTLERIDFLKNYEPSNCTWIPKSEQSKNRKTLNFITYNGETLCVAEMSRKYGLKRQTLDHRLKLGWTVDKALTTPLR